MPCMDPMGYISFISYSTALLPTHSGGLYSMNHGEFPTRINDGSVVPSIQGNDPKYPPKVYNNKKQSLKHK